MPPESNQSLTRDISPLSTRAVFQPGTFNREKGTVVVKFATEKKVRTFNWEDWEYINEILEMSPEAMMMERFDNGAVPFKTDHSRGIATQLGKAVRAWFENNEAYAEILLSKRKEFAGYIDDIEAGVLSSVSVGYRVHKYQDITESDDKIRTLKAIKWEPYEISLVDIPADENSKIRSDITETNIVEIMNLRSMSEKETEIMPPVDQNPESKRTETPAATPAQPATAPASQAAPVQDGERSATIFSLGRRAKMTDEEINEMLRSNLSVDQARERAFEKLAVQDAAAPTSSQRVEVIQDEHDVRRESIESALLHRHDQTKYKLEKNGARYMSMSLLEMARTFVSDSDAVGLSKSGIAMRALTSSDFGHILANVAGKSVQESYKAATKTFSPFVKPGTLPDYKSMKVVRVENQLVLKEVKENGEYEEGIVTDAGEELRLSKFGRLFNISEEAIVNDDMEQIAQIPGMYGAACARLESRLVYLILTGSHKMSDNQELFHASHGNLASATAINEAGLSAMRALMRKQKVGEDFLELYPEFLVCGPDKELEAQKILTAITAAKSGDVNPFQGSLKPIIAPQIVGNAWFLLGNPSQHPLISVRTLQGMNGPEITKKVGFEVDGVQIKCKHVFTAKALDWRNLVKNPGA